MKKIILLILTSISFTCYSQEEEVFLIVEQMPSFNGGDITEYKKYLTQNLRYPEYAAQIGVFGRVSVSFIVDESGLIRKTKLVTSSNPILDSAAIKIIRDSPVWIPGFQREKPLSVAYTISINFMLGNRNDMKTEEQDVVCLNNKDREDINIIPLLSPVEASKIIDELYSWLYKPRFNKTSGTNKGKYKIKVQTDLPFETVCVVNTDQTINTISPFDAGKTLKVFNNLSSTEITIIGFKVINNVAFFSRQSITPSKTPIQLDYKPIDLPGLKKELQEIEK